MRLNKILRDKVEAYYSINNGAAPWSTLVSRMNALTDQYKTLIDSHPPGKARKAGRNGGVQ